MAKDGNGLTKARSITGTIAAIIGTLTFFVTVLFFFFSLRAGLDNLTLDFEKHEEAESQKLAHFVPKTELEIEYRIIKETLGDIKVQLKSCQEEDKLFKDKLFEFMLEIKNK